MNRQPQASPRIPTTVKEPTASEALAQARRSLITACEALARADGRRQAEYARLVIDAAATVLADPAALRREVVAAHSILREALEVDGRPNTCGAEYIDISAEASDLPSEDQEWLREYLSPTPVGVHAESKRGARRAITLRRGIRRRNPCQKSPGGTD